MDIPFSIGRSGRVGLRPGIAHLRRIPAAVRRIVYCHCGLRLHGREPLNNSKPSRIHRPGATTSVAVCSASGNLAGHARQITLIGFCLIALAATFAFAAQAASAAPLFDPKDRLPHRRGTDFRHQRRLQRRRTPRPGSRQPGCRQRLDPARRRQRRLRAKGRLPDRYEPHLGCQRRLQRRRKTRPGGGQRWLQHRLDPVRKWDWSIWAEDRLRDRCVPPIGRHR